MYRALYRKDRPRTFSAVDGQEHVTKTLRTQVDSGRLSHAYLFVGSRGTGKTSCAKILSRAVNCLEPSSGDPCNKCVSCVGIENGSILDVLEIDAASHSGVDYARSLRDEAIYSPAAVKKRVYIIDEVHMLSTAAFNALLKVMEEPPQHLMFILATTELHKVPATILSRCQRFSFKRLTPQVIAARLITVAKNEGHELSDDAADKLAFLADGSMRDAMSLLDQCLSKTEIDLQHVLDTIKLATADELIIIVKSIASGDIAAMLSAVDQQYQSGKDMNTLLGELLSLFRDVLLYGIMPQNPLLSGLYSAQEISELSLILQRERLLYSLQLINETLAAISKGAVAKLSTEMCLIKLSDLKLSENISAILARLEALEASGRGAKPSCEFSERKAQEKSLPLQEEVQQNAECEEQEILAQHSKQIEPELDEHFTQVESQVEAQVESHAGNDEVEPYDQPEDLQNQPNELPNQDEAINDDEQTWQKILSELSGEPQAYAALSDKVKIRCVIKSNVVTVKGGDDFVVDMIKGSAIMKPLENAVMKLLGDTASVMVEKDVGILEEARKKLDELSRFDIVTVKE